ncbi:MAG: hypothetical protein QOD75_1694 [Blastocatellia bacterium]|jgi:hypothetical protein|nr:hypothetical protein [Blastocatellia bacterium]
MAFSDQSVLNLDGKDPVPAADPVSSESSASDAKGKGLGESDGPQRVSSLPELFSSPDERKEIAVGLALAGSTLEEALRHVQSFYSTLQQRIEKAYHARLARIGDVISNRKTELEERQTIANNSKKELETLRIEHGEVEKTIPLLEQQNGDAWQKILHHRFETGRQFFENQEEHLEGLLKDNRKAILAEIDAQIEIDQKIYEIQKTNRDINRSEFERRVELCKEEKTKIEKQIEDAVKYTDNLKTIGVTRTSATFLFVAGFISIAGVGSVISSLLQGREPGDDLLSRIIGNLDLIVGGLIPERFAPFRAPLKPFLFIVLLLLFLIVFYVVIRFMDWLLRKFDLKGWTGESDEDRESDKANRGNKTLHEQFTGFTSSALSIKSQLSNFISLDLQRKDYTKLLASFPYLFLGGIIVFLFSGVDSNGKVLSLTTAYVGVIFALLATSVSVLYVTKVIEPRWDLAARTRGNPSPVDGNNEPKQKRAFARFVGINRELGALFLLMVLSLIAAAFIPTQDQGWRYFSGNQMNLIVWGLVAVFMCLSSLGLAYGIIQRGLFRDVDHLIRRRNEYRTLIEKFSMQPVVGGVGYGRSYGTDSRSSNYSDLLQNLEEQRLWYEMNEIFGDDFEFNENPPEDKSLRSLWFVLRKPKRKARRPWLGLRFKKEIATEPRVMDFSVAPEETKAFITTREDIKRHQAKKGELTDRIKLLVEKINSLHPELTDLRLGNIADEALKRSIEQDLESELTSLIMAREKDLMEFRGSFAIGFVARNLLKKEGVLPGDLASEREPYQKVENPQPSPTGV